MVAYSPDGKYLALSDYEDSKIDSIIKICDVATGRLLHTLKGFSTYDVWSLAYSPDGKHLASVNSDWSARIWDLAAGKLLFTLRSHSVTSAAFSPDGKQLASGIWNTESVL